MRDNPPAGPSPRRDQGRARRRARIGLVRRSWRHRGSQVLDAAGYLARHPSGGVA